MPGILHWFIRVIKAIKLPKAKHRVMRQNVGLLGLLGDLRRTMPKVRQLLPALHMKL